MHGAASGAGMAWKRRWGHRRPRIGFIGLGIMGRPMARNLLRAGYSLTVYNRSRGPVDELAAEGAAPAGSPAELAAESDVIITIVTDSPDVEEVIAGERGVIHNPNSTRLNSSH